jgi:hypothetical protein
MESPGTRARHHHPQHTTPKQEHRHIDDDLGASCVVLSTPPPNPASPALGEAWVDAGSARDADVSSEDSDARKAEASPAGGPGERGAHGSARPALDASWWQRLLALLVEKIRCALAYGASCSRVCERVCTGLRGFVRACPSSRGRCRTRLRL